MGTRVCEAREECLEISLQLGQSCGGDCARRDEWFCGGWLWAMQVSPGGQGHAPRIAEGARSRRAGMTMPVNWQARGAVHRQWQRLDSNNSNSLLSALPHVFWMLLHQLDLTTALRPSLLPEEALLFVQDAVGLYEGYADGLHSCRMLLTARVQQVQDPPVPEWPGILDLVSRVLCRPQ